MPVVCAGRSNCFECCPGERTAIAPAHHVIGLGGGHDHGRLSLLAAQFNEISFANGLAIDDHREEWVELEKSHEPAMGTMRLPCAVPAIVRRPSATRVVTAFGRQQNQPTDLALCSSANAA